MFSVVDFVTAVPPSSRDRARIGRPLLYVLRDTARRRPLPPPVAPRAIVQAAHDRRTPAARSKERSRALRWRIPAQLLRAGRFCLRVRKSPAPGLERLWSAEKTAP